MKNSAPLGPYSRPMPWVLGGSKGGGRFLVSEVPLYTQRVHRAFTFSGPCSDAASVGVHTYLTDCMNQRVSESQLPHKLVNLLFTIAYQDNTLTILWGS